MGSVLGFDNQRPVPAILADGASLASGIAGGGLLLAESRDSAVIDLSRFPDREPFLVSMGETGDGQEDELARASALPDEQSFSSGRRNTPSCPRCASEAVFGSLHPPPPSTITEKSANTSEIRPLRFEIRHS